MLTTYKGVARKFCRGQGPGAKPLEADKISTYSFSFEVSEIQINKLSP